MAKTKREQVLEAALRRALSYIETYGTEDRTGELTDQAQAAVDVGRKALGLRAAGGSSESRSPVGTS